MDTRKRYSVGVKGVGMRLRGVSRTVDRGSERTIASVASNILEVRSCLKRSSNLYIIRSLSQYTRGCSERVCT